MVLDSNEKILIEKCKKGDVYAFEDLISVHQKKAYNIAYRILENAEDASDATQEAFIKVFKGIKDFKEESSFSTWLFRIVTNVSLDQLRAKKRSATYSIDKEIVTDQDAISVEIADYSSIPEDVIDRKEDLKEVHQAINLLSQEHKTVIVLRDIQGFSYEEVAQITNSSVGTVKSRLNRARQNLKLIISKHRELSTRNCV